jgi:S1/P1 Nuclease
VSHPKLFSHLVRLALSLTLIVEASPVWAWGDLGHRVICQIAFQELNDTARNEVIRLIALDGTFDSFTDACTWPDHPRKRAEEHFVNVPRSLQTITTTGCHGVPKCLFTAIPADLEVLRTSHDDAARLASLKYLGHWIGDVHQPLHVSFADDRGGNFIRESGPCVNSLHTVWDTCIIEKKLGTDPQTIARDLLDGLSTSDRAAWIAVPIAGWANESFQVTRRKSVQYCVRVGAKCFYQQGNETFSEGEDEKVVIVNAAYLELHVPFVRDRLKRAGIRLGHLLNTTLGQ